VFYPIFPFFMHGEKEGLCAEDPLFLHTLGRKRPTMRLISLINHGLEPRVLSPQHRCQQRSTSRRARTSGDAGVPRGVYWEERYTRVYIPGCTYRGIPPGCTYRIYHQGVPPSYPPWCTSVIPTRVYLRHTHQVYLSGVLHWVYLSGVLHWVYLRVLIREAYIPQGVDQGGVHTTGCVPGRVYHRMCTRQVYIRVLIRRVYTSGC